MQYYAVQRNVLKIQQKNVPKTWQKYRNILFKYNCLLHLIRFFVFRKWREQSYFSNPKYFYIMPLALAYSENLTLIASLLAFLTLSALFAVKKLAK